MKILIPTVDYPPIEGGIGTIARELSRELAALGHEVTVIAPYFPGMEDFDRDEPVTVIRFRGYGLGWVRFLPFAMRTWPKLGQYDAVLGLNAAYGALLASYARCPYIAFAYGYEFLKFADGPAIARGLVRRAYTRAQAVIAISHFTRDRLVDFGVDAQRIRTVLPGATPIEQAPDRDALDRLRIRYDLQGKPVVLSTGRLVSRKGFDTLTRAFAKLLEQEPSAMWVVIGRGPEERRIREEARRLNIEDHVLLLGKVDDDELRAWFEIADLFALLPREERAGQVEGFGLVFAEAAAHGVPVVATHSGGIPDAVLDGQTGWLVAPDDAEAAADAMQRVLQSPELARQLGAAARKRVETELNWTHFARGVLDALENGACGA